MGNFNSVIFPKPEPTYNSVNLNLIWIPKRVNLADYSGCTTSSFFGNSVPDNFKIPCLFLPSEKPTKKIVIYFHGNAEDIGLS